MLLSDGTHLSYCTNIHPGESLAEVEQALATHVLRVKAQVAPDRRFGVGLRLSNAAVVELLTGDALARLRAFLDAHDLYVFTINGFPYGAFHGTRVKESVYLPDWREPERLAYSDRLAQALCALLPEGVDGSVSTVPCGFASELQDDAAVRRTAEQMITHAARLHALRERTGRSIALALEPEPSCHVETTTQCVQHFETWLLSQSAVARMAELTGTSRATSEAALRRHLGVCLDACHAAVEHEEPGAVLAAFSAAGIDVKKVQLSSGLRAARLSPEARAALHDFADDVYLHQAVARAGDTLHRYVDLPQALAAAEARDHELRVHFHVPLFVERYGVLDSTQAFVRELLARHATAPISRQLEVETYTWDVLPPALRSEDVAHAIARELDFVLRALSGTLPP